MTQAAPASLEVWSTFYAMTGSSAAALTGLMFVVITLVGGERRRTTVDGISTFSTPTVMHFGAAFLVSAVLVAPLRSPLLWAASIGFIGLYGVVYVLRVAYRWTRLRAYVPDVEDWAWYTIFPFLAYGAIVAGAIGFPLAWALAPFTPAGGVVLLIFIGIRNAWDVVTFIAMQQLGEAPSSNRKDEASAFEETR